MFTIKKNWDKLMFVNKNWPNDSRIGWKAFFLSLVGLIENDEDSKDLREFLRSF
jgi:hypothetical protein